MTRSMPGAHQYQHGNRARAEFRYHESICLEDLTMKHCSFLLAALLLLPMGCAEPPDLASHTRSLTHVAADIAVDALAPGVCGDGMVNEGEECDDGNTKNNDGCSSDCKYEYCGDGIVQAALGEQCDDGGYRNDDGCDMFCQIERFPGPVPARLPGTDGGLSQPQLR